MVAVLVDVCMNEQYIPSIVVAKNAKFAYSIILSAS